MVRVLAFCPATNSTWSGAARSRRNLQDQGDSAFNYARRMGGAKRYPSMAGLRTGWVREELNPSCGPRIRPHLLARSIVIFALNNIEPLRLPLAGDAIDQPVFAGDPA